MYFIVHAAFMRGA